MIRTLRTVSALLLAAVCTVGFGAKAALPVDDGPEGMTCHYFAKAGLVQWERNGGDWIDADGKTYGENAYAAQRVALSPGAQPVSWDLSTLVGKWASGELPAGAVLLRAMPNTGGGTVNFSSREQASADVRPALVVEWDDGQEARLEPMADSYFACPTHRGTGSALVFQVSSDMNAVLAFPFENRPGRSIRKATLTLTSDKQYAQPPQIGVFHARLPGTDKTEKQQGLAASYLADRGIEKNPALIVAYRFEANGEFPLPTDKAEGQAELVSSDPANRFSPLDGRALKVTIPQGGNQGLNRHLKFQDRPGGEPEEAYLRYYLRLGESWNPSRDGGKLPGLAGIYDRGGWGARKSDGKNGWSTRGGFFVQPKPSSPYAKYRGIGSYVYHARMRDQYGEVWGWGLGPTGLLEKNRWYCVEQRVKLNTPGQADGVLQAWVDGKLVFSREDIIFRSVPELRIESAWLNVYHGGTTAAPQDLTLYIDNLVVARRYIGPARLSRD